jgi:ubiquinone/menaquinone biosynthesis C-methylase UbiE
MGGSASEPQTTNAPTIYLHPLAYLLALEGIALLRAFTGEYDRQFTLDRFREIQALLDSADEFGDGIEVAPITTAEAYDSWAPYYDEPGNQMIEIEEPCVREILDGLPVGVALDAACGTGRHSAYLASLGHRVIGVETSPQMLAQARERVPGAEFYEADLHNIPLDDDSVDLVVCGLALMHVPDLARAMAEFTRVLRPNGHLVISDSRGLAGRRMPVATVGPNGELGYMPLYNHRTSDYLKAALPLGLQVRRCEEPTVPSPLLADDGTTIHDGVRLPDCVPGEPFSIWQLHARAVEATNAAWRDKPVVIVWHFQL